MLSYKLKENVPNLKKVVKKDVKKVKTHIFLL